MHKPPYCQSLPPSCAVVMYPHASESPQYQFLTVMYSSPTWAPVSATNQTARRRARCQRNRAGSIMRMKRGRQGEACSHKRQATWEGRARGCSHCDCVLMIIVTVVVRPQKIANIMAANPGALPRGSSAPASIAPSPFWKDDILRFGGGPASSRFKRSKSSWLVRLFGIVATGESGLKKHKQRRELLHNHLFEVD
jgi:hypothetical protein